MSLFPSVQPSARTFTPGTIPINSYQALSGKEVRVLLADTVSNHSLALTFSNILEAPAKSILDHWYAQSGTALAFNLPAAVWAGWAEYESAITPTQKWRYDSVPRVVAVSPGIMTVTVQLVSLA
jgi:hypothetical protein